MAAAAGAGDAKTSAQPKLKPIDEVRPKLAQLVIGAVKKVYGEDVSDMADEIAAKGLGKLELEGRVAFPTFVISKRLKKMKPDEQIAMAQALAKAIEESAQFKELLHAVVAEKHFVNMFLSTPVLASVCTAVDNGSFLQPLSSDGKDRVMIEYSQPNTHKAFHVGHMRNAALGDSLVRLYEACGHHVTAANYFGDEGAHIAKCLWYLQKHVAETKLDLKSVPADSRGEFLGEMYSKAVDELELSAFTKYPFPGVIGVKVVSVDKHPDATAPPNWHKVVVQLGADATKTAVVICGGTGYKVGDVVAYTPVGGKLKDKAVEPKDMKGVASCGVIMGLKELDIEEEDPSKAEAAKKKEADAKAKEDAAKAKSHGGAAKGKGDDKKAAAGDDKKKADKADKKADKKKDDKPAAAAGDKKAKADKKDAPAGEAKGAATPSSKKGKGGESQNANSKIFVLPEGTPIGIPLTEVGRKAGTSIPAGVAVEEEVVKRNKEVGAMLLAMETQEPKISALWAETKDWSLKEFKKIYQWLDCRFDHDFFESEVGEESKHMVQEFHKKGVLKSSGQAVVADLSEYKLGFCVLLKSNGAGLYATKDLALARRKFDKFNIDKSIYVVDAAQTLHFQQVFKTLELFGYEKAKKCLHLPYGLVVLPNGKMSSRKGTVILFSQLVKMLSDQINKEYLDKQKVPMEAKEKADINHAISVATIKFGMLNHDRMSDIVFKMDDWTAHGGMNGPYMMYAYARTRSIRSKVQAAADAKVDYALLTHRLERSTLTMMHNFWPVVQSCITKNNASGLCEYVYDLAKAYSSWYDNDDCSVKETKDKNVQATRLAFVDAFAKVMQKALYLLGIKTVERM